MRLGFHMLGLPLVTLLFTTGVPPAVGLASAAEDSDTDVARSLEHGRFLVQYGGCNDCHTPGYGEKAGNIPEKDWLVGSDVGFRGPWGTSYATNLRLQMQQLSFAQWVQIARLVQTLPPMPWFNLRLLTDGDLRAMYDYIRSLGPAGREAPTALGPETTPKTKYINYVPVNPS